MKSIVMGKITPGTSKSGAINFSSAKGREGKQRRVGSIHTHPINEVNQSNGCKDICNTEQAWH